MIKNVIFDVGKVLVEWDCDSALRRLGFDERARQAVVQATVRSPYWNELDRSAVSDGELLAHFLDGAKGYEREVRLFWDNIGLAIQTYPYSRSWIQGLKKAGYGVYILSNYGRRTYGQTREELSFAGETDGALFSFEVHQIKPEPEIYQTLLARYGLKPGECVFLDDVQANIDAAEALGIRGICFTGYEEAVRQLRECGVCIPGQ